MEPIIEQIAAAIEARLLTITTANGYQVSVAGVLRPTQFGIDAISPRNNLLVMVQADARLDEVKRHPPGPTGRDLIDWWQPWVIGCYVQTSESSTDEADKLMNRLRSSVEKALLVDPGWGPTPTQPLANETKLVTSEYFPIDPPGGYAGVAVVMEVSYTTLEKDPYTQPTL